MSVLVGSALGIFLGQKVLTLVVHDLVNTLGGRSTHVRSKHDVVRAVTAKLLLVKTCRKQLDVCALAVNVLSLLNGVLDD
jgi:hypothetical protein